MKSVPICRAVQLSWKLRRAARAKADGEEPSVQEQLALLQRKVRILEGDHRSYSEDAQKTLRQQRQAVEKLRAENKALKVQQALETLSDMAAPSSLQQQQIVQLTNIIDVFTHKVDVERRRLDEVHKAVAECQAKALDTRKDMGGAFAASQTSRLLQQQTKVLGTRLERSLAKFNEAQAANKRMRGEIDDLRLGRSAFKEAHRKLEREVADKKRQMADVIEITNLACEARDQHLRQVAALRAQSDNEQAAFESQMAELAALLEADRKLREQSRRNYQHGSLTVEQEKSLRGRVAKGAWNLTTKEAEVSQTAEKVLSYDEAFKRIRHITGLQDMEQIVQQFIDNEETSFSMFAYITHLSNEAERLSAEVEAAEGELELSRQQAQQAAELRQSTGRDMALRVSAAVARADKLHAKVDGMQQRMQECARAVEQLMRQAGCEMGSMHDVRGHEGVTESNLIHCLGAVEERASLLMQSHLFVVAGRTALDGPAGPAGNSLRTGGALVPHGSATISIRPPSTEPPSNAEDEGANSALDVDQPLSRADIEAHILSQPNSGAAPGGANKTLGRRTSIAAQRYLEQFGALPHLPAATAATPADGASAQGAC
ncbi:hypothetical protein WJX72_003673 [[Myrmecia] bisecta]|uniref:ODAD1 central coiled coil region domain-containing protein n=1 Tax=[Myrmecia] bisecta TaxID=41462 RepID=A0AAW1Q4I1_9CHLO